MTKFCPSLWPEDQTPDDEINCADCGLIEHGSRMIWGEGNPNARIFVLLDNPGARENRDGDPFVCRTRITLQKAIHDTGLSVDDIYVSWVLKRRPTKQYDKDTTRRICLHHVSEQLEKMNPELVVCLGNVALQSFLQDDQINVKSMRGKSYHINGFQIITAYHPLAIHRRPNLRPGFSDDWNLVKDVLKNK